MSQEMIKAAKKQRTKSENGGKGKRKQVDPFLRKLSACILQDRRQAISRSVPAYRSGKPNWKQYYQRLAEEQGKGQRPGRKKGKKASLEGRVTSCIINAAYPAALQEQLKVPFEPIKGAPSGIYYRPYLGMCLYPAF
jgi:hypothetical protein